MMHDAPVRRRSRFKLPVQVDNSLMVNNTSNINTTDATEYGECEDNNATISCDNNKPQMKDAMKRVQIVQRKIPSSISAPINTATNNDDLCCMCQSSLRRMTAMERQLHIMECVDKNEIPNSVKEETLVECPQCKLNITHMTLDERSVHINDCFDRQEEDKDFSNESVLKTFETRMREGLNNLPLDLSEKVASCFVCDKCLERLSLSKRVAHVSVCSRLDEQIVRELFVRSGVEQVHDTLQRPKWDRSKGINPTIIVHRLRTQMLEVDRQITTLAHYRQRLKLQLDKAVCLSSELAEPERNAICNAAEYNLSKNVELTSADEGYMSDSPMPIIITPRMKPSRLATRFRKKNLHLDDDDKYMQPRDVSPPDSELYLDMDDECVNDSINDDCIHDLIDTANQCDGELQQTSIMSNQEFRHTTETLSQFCVPSQPSPVRVVPPAPDYTLMSKDELKKQLVKYGLKPGSKSFMIAQMRNVWQAIHTCSPTPPTPPTSSSSSTAAASISSSSSQSNIVSQAMVTSTTCRQRVRVCNNTDTNKKLMLFIHKHQKLHEHLLLLGSIELSDFVNALHTSSLKISRQAVIRFLDTHGIAYSVKRN